MSKNKIAIIGYGTVGKAMHALFPDALIYNGEKHPKYLENRHIAFTVAQCNEAYVLKTLTQ